MRGYKLNKLETKIEEIKDDRERRYRPWIRKVKKFSNEREE